MSSKLTTNILIVDDDAINRKLLCAILKKFHYTLETATNGFQALEMLETKPFDLVILDLLMPAMDGYQTLQAMKKDIRYRDIPVIIASAVRDKESVIQCIEAGAEEYMVKPYEQEIIRSRVRAVLDAKHIKELESELEQAKEREKQLLAQIAELRINHKPDLVL